MGNLFIIPTRCPICLRESIKKTVSESTNELHWIYCDHDNALLHKRLWHFALQIIDCKIVHITVADEDRGIHVGSSLANSITKINKIVSEYNVEAIQVVPYAIHFNYMDPESVKQKLKFLATYL